MWNQLAVLGLAVSIVSGCGGAKILKEPTAQPATAILTTAIDDRLTADLQWIIVRDGPGTWVSPADWDEYVFSFVNLSGEPLTVTGVTLVDSLGEKVSEQNNRRALVKGTRKTAKRYKKANIEVHAGMTGVGLFGTGSAMMLAGGYAGLHAAFGALAGTTAGAVVGPAAVVAVYAAPVVLVNGVVRGINNIKIDNQIEDRQSSLPFDVPAQGAKSAHIFYPISPSPGLIEITYSDSNGDHVLTLDTREVLSGLHLKSLEKSTSPAP